jgi:hypothetical protein
MTPLKLFTFALPAELKEGLRMVKARDGVSEAEQIRRGIQLWLKSKGVSETPKRSARTPRKA